jgi:endonuclease III
MVEVLRHSSAPPVDRNHVRRWRRISARTNRLAGETERALRALATELHALHGTPHLGNLRDPTDEYAYIILSRKTRESAYQQAFGALKKLGGWSEIAEMSETRIAAAIHGCGLECKKAHALLAGLRAARARFGAPNFKEAASLDDQSLFDFLRDLPEVGPKSALCIMLYSFGRPTFPVDAHVGRVLARLGVLDHALPGLTQMNHKQRQAALVEAIPPDLRYGLHVNLVAHGRSFCRSASPRCADCPVASRCSHAQQRGGRGLSSG